MGTKPARHGGSGRSMQDCGCDGRSRAEREVERGRRTAGHVLARYQRGQQLGQPRALADRALRDGALGHVLALVDHDRVPATRAQEPAVFLVALERVDRDDHPIVDVKRVHVGGVRRCTRSIPALSRRTSGIVKRDHSSIWNCSSTERSATTKIRRPRPRRISSESSTPTSTVLPSPTPSAIRMRARAWASARPAGSSW